MRRRHIRTASRYSRTADTVEALCHTGYDTITTVAEGYTPESRGMVEVDLEHTQLWCCRCDPEPWIVFSATTVDAGIGNTSSRLKIRAWKWNISQVNGWSAANRLANTHCVQLGRVAVKERVEYLVRFWTRRRPLGGGRSAEWDRPNVTVDEGWERSDREC